MQVFVLLIPMHVFNNMGIIDEIFCKPDKNKVVVGGVFISMEA